MRKLIVITRGLDKEDYDFIQLIKRYLQPQTKIIERKSEESFQRKINFGANLQYEIITTEPVISFTRRINIKTTLST